MFTRLKAEETDEVLEYFSRDRKNCLYSYIDLKKYGLEHPKLAVYVDRWEGTGQEGRRGGIRCVLTKYYDGVNVFSQGDALDGAGTAYMLKTLAPAMINAPASTIRMLLPFLEASAENTVYEREEGYVTEIRRVGAETGTVFPDVEEVPEEDLAEAACLICTDEGLGGTYTVEGLAAQLLERRRDGFGRNLCIRRNGKMVCHAGTYAEVEDLAVISGVITAEDSRGQNLAYRVVSKLSMDLLAEGKLPCLFYYTKSAARLYEKVGFEPGTPWAKLIRKQG